MADIRIQQNVVRLPIHDYQFKKCKTPAQRKLYIALAARGYSVQTQISIGHGRWKADFMLSEYKLVIDCKEKDRNGNGANSPSRQQQHIGMNRINQTNRVNQSEMDRFLQLHDWEVLRFAEKNIHQELEKVMASIHARVTTQRKGDPIENLIRIT
jgi:very-short-patch-repair endonuclease